MFADRHTICVFACCCNCKHHVDRETEQSKVRCLVLGGFLLTVDGVLSVLFFAFLSLNNGGNMAYNDTYKTLGTQKVNDIGADYIKTKIKLVPANVDGCERAANTTVRLFSLYVHTFVWLIRHWQHKPPL